MSRKDRSLYAITKRILELLDCKHVIKMQDLASLTCKRRCYDVILVLEAAGKLRRYKTNKVVWITKATEGPAIFDEDFIEDFFDLTC